MTDGEFRLRAVTQDEFDRWLPEQEADYTQHIIDSGGLPPDQAREKARLDTERSLPDGLASPGELIFRLVAGDEPVGWLWLSLGSSSDPRMAWVKSISVDAVFRGRGYGRQGMLFAEQEARSRGMTSIGLNVHGRNTVARSLYESLGYEVTAQQMKKPV